MASLYPLLLLMLKLVATYGVSFAREHHRLASGSPHRTRIHVAAILPDAKRSVNRQTAPWPFSTQNVSPAVDVALRSVSSARTVFDVK